MAFGMKHWIGLTAVGLAVVGVSLLPPASPTWTSWTVAIPRTQEEIHAEALGKEVTRMQHLVQRRAWADSLSAVAMAQAEDGLAIGGSPELLNEDRMIGLKARLDFEVASRGPIRPDVTLGVFAQSRLQSWPGATRLADPRVTEELFVGQRDGRTYCLNLLIARRPGGAIQALGEWNRSAGSNVLGACTIVARYGHPGPEILAWLKDGGVLFGSAPADLPPPSTQGIWEGRGKVLFGVRMGQFASTGRIYDDECRAGIPSGCQEAFEHPYVDSYQSSFRYLTANSDLVATSISRYSSPFGPMSAYVLADLEADFGSDAFERFWQSDRSVSEAFEEAFGTSAGEWMVGWVDDNLGIRDAGPDVKKGSLFQIMLLLSFCGGIGAFCSLRRSVA